MLILVFSYYSMTTTTTTTNTEATDDVGQAVWPKTRHTVV